jgi:hypothetical protein
VIGVAEEHRPISIKQRLCSLHGKRRGVEITKAKALRGMQTS